MTIPSDALIAVIGAGTMGAGIAQVAAAAGHRVVVVDARAAGLEQGRATVAASTAALVARDRLDDAAKAAIEGRISWTETLADAADAALVIEAIVEQIEAKRSLFGALAAVVSPSAILASNTSSLPIAAIAEGVAAPERVVGLHFFNPVPAMALVEVIAGPATPPATLDAVTDLMSRWGKKPVAVRDVPGFIVNRVARPYYGEGFAALGEGIDAALIDQALTQSGGFRMGPLALADLIGHDINYAVACSIFEAYEGHTRFRPSTAQQQLVESGRLGRKSGRGVFDYKDAMPSASVVEPTEAPGKVRVSAELGLLSALVERLRAEGVATDSDSSLPPASLAFGDTIVALGDGRTLATRPGISALLDHARDFAKARALVIATDDASAAAQVAALAAKIGCQTLLVPDRPGQLVLRTLAQLANTAADAASDEVASREGIDTALLYGANHPQGPLHWAGRTGSAFVTEALRNIAHATGDAMYEPSPTLATL